MKLDSLQVGWALAAQYVVLYHAPFILQQQLGLNLSSRILDAGHSGVEYFFVLSGFIMYHVHWKDVGHAAQIRRFAVNRFIRIYPLFWIVFGIFVLGQLATGHLEHRLNSLGGFMRALALLPFPGGPPLTVAWTLSHEMLFYLMLGMCILFGRRGVAIILAWWAVCLCVLAISLLTGFALPFSLDFLFSPYNLLFGMGMLAAASVERVSLSRATMLLSAGLIGFACTIGVDHTLPAEGRVILYGLAAMAIVVGGAAIETLRHVTFPGWMVRMGDASYSTYLIHTVAMLICAILMRRLGLDPEATMAFLLLVAVGTLAGLALHVGVEKPLLKLLRGRRVRLQPT